EVLGRGAGMEEPVREAKVASGVVGLRASECGAQGSQGVLVEGATICEPGADEREFLRERSHADAEHQAPAAEAIERPIALRYLEGVMVREHEYVRDEADARRACGEEAEGRERVVVACAPHRRDRGGD